MKQFIFLSLLVLLITQAFAVSNSQASNNSSQASNNSSQPIILLGEINDQSPGAESYESKVPPPINKALQEQNAISAAYDQKQEEIAEEEDYFDEMNDFGMFGKFTEFSSHSVIKTRTKRYHEVCFTHRHIGTVTAVHS